MRDLAAIVAIYLIALAALLRWHWLQGPPHTQATLGLLVAFGLCAALVGLSSISVALAALHWTRRVSGLIVGLAVLGLFWAPLFAWNEFLLWQLIVMFAVQTGCLVLALGISSSIGWRLTCLESADRGALKPGSSQAFQLSISDFLIFAGALALLCAVMRGSRACRTSGRLFYALNAAGGCAASGGRRTIGGSSGRVSDWTSVLAEGGRARPRRADRRGRLRRGLPARPTPVQLAVVLRCDHCARPLHEHTLSPDEIARVSVRQVSGVAPFAMGEGKIKGKALSSSMVPENSPFPRAGEAGPAP